MAWNASPVSTARTCAEVVEPDPQTSNTHGVGSELPQHVAVPSVEHGQALQLHGPFGRRRRRLHCSASLGAALANKQHGRVTVSLNGDGDLMMSPGVLWTAAHHQIPILYVVHNNRAYHQETMHLQRIAQRNQRGMDRAHIGTTIDNPNIDFATLAKSMGVYSQGPIENPADLGPAITRALDVVKRGQPALDRRRVSAALIMRSRGTVSRSVWMLGAGVVAGLMGLSAALAQDTPRGDVANGKKLFETVGCFQCHGFAGQGGAAGPKLIDPAPYPGVHRAAAHAASGHAALHGARADRPAGRRHLRPREDVPAAAGSGDDPDPAN